MNPNHYKIILLSLGLAIALLIASSGASVLIPAPSGEEFSELYVLGPQRLAADYPHNVVPGNDYTVFLNVGNHMGSTAYYLVYVKLLVTSDNLPNTDLRTASPVKALYEKRFIVMDGDVFEVPITFSISSTVVSENQIRIDRLLLNDDIIELNKMVTWNSTKSEYPFRLLFELWNYNTQLNIFEFDNRFVYLGLNCTQTA